MILTLFFPIVNSIILKILLEFTQTLYYNLIDTDVIAYTIFLTLFYLEVRFCHDDL